MRHQVSIMIIHEAYPKYLIGIGARDPPSGIVPTPHSSEWDQLCSSLVELSLDLLRLQFVLASVLIYGINEK